MDGRDPSNHVLEVQDFPFVVVVAGDLPTHLQKVPNIHKTSRTGGNGWEETPRNLPPPRPLPFGYGEREREREREMERREEPAGCDREAEGSWASAPQRPMRPEMVGLVMPA